MSRIHRGLRALAFLFVLFPLWWLQRTHANPMSESSRAGGHGHPAKPVTPGGDAGARLDSGGDSDDHDEGDDDDGDDGDDDDGGGITDCNNNGIDDSIDISSGTSLDDNQNGIPDECEFFVTSFCNGTGPENGGVDCPCGNNVPPGGLTGCANSTGTGATLQANGDALVSHDTLILTATNIPVGKAGYFLVSTQMTTGSPFGDGVRCITQFTRLAKVSSSTGHDQFPPPNSLPISQQLGITAGETTLFQVIYRDAAGPCHNGANATNGELVHWGP